MTYRELASGYRFGLYWSNFNVYHQNEWKCFKYWLLTTDKPVDMPVIPEENFPF